MKAALYERYGAAGEVLRVEEVERPEPGPGDVRVRVRVSGVNPTDVSSRSGASISPRPIDGFQIPHHDGAGVIDAVGPGVDPGRVGQRVWLRSAATRRWGTAAQWTVVPDQQAVRLPAGVSFDLGANLGVPALTAHRCLFADGPVNCKSVLVAGGAGAVGHFAIELARHAGARVIATVSTPEKAEMAVKAGAHDVVNYRDPNAIDQVRELVDRVDRIVEVNVDANLALDLAVSGPETVIAAYASTGHDSTLPVWAYMAANATLRFVMLYGVPRPAQEQAAADVTAALAADALSPLPAHRFALDDIVAAHEAAEKGVTGKVLVDIP